MPAHAQSRTQRVRDTPPPTARVPTPSNSASFDEFAGIVQVAFSNLFPYLDKREALDAADRVAVREKVNKVDEKADVTNYKADKNAEKLKAVIAMVHANKQELVGLQRKDATREAELRKLKHDRDWAIFALVIVFLFLLCCNNDTFTIFAGAMAFVENGSAHVRHIVNVAWIYLVEFVAKAETDWNWRACIGNLSFLWKGQA